MLYIFVIIYMTVMCTCTHVHDNVSCTRLQNYMIVYTNMVALTKLVLRVYTFTKLHDSVHKYGGIDKIGAQK